MSELNDFLMEYHRKFKQSFPVLVVGNTDEECITEIKKCLESGKPYVCEFDFDENILY